MYEAILKLKGGFAEHMSKIPAEVSTRVLK